MDAAAERTAASCLILRRKRNVPGGHYLEARWDYEEPETIYLTLGEWLVVI